MRGVVASRGMQSEAFDTYQKIPVNGRDMCLIGEIGTQQ